MLVKFHRAPGYGPPPPPVEMSAVPGEGDAVEVDGRTHRVLRVVWFPYDPDVGAWVQVNLDANIPL